MQLNLFSSPKTKKMPTKKTGSKYSIKKLPNGKYIYFYEAGKETAKQFNTLNEAKRSVEKDKYIARYGLQSYINKTKKMPTKKAAPKKKVVRKKATAKKCTTTAAAKKKIAAQKRTIAAEKKKIAALTRKNKAKQKKLAKIRRTSKVVRKRKKK
jgi:hypothetical protein